VGFSNIVKYKKSTERKRMRRMVKDTRRLMMVGLISMPVAAKFISALVSGLKKV